MSKLEGCSCPQGASFRTLPGSLCIFIIASGIGDWLVLAHNSFFVRMPDYLWMVVVVMGVTFASILCWISHKTNYCGCHAGLLCWPLTSSVDSCGLCFGLCGGGCSFIWGWWDIPVGRALNLTLCLHASAPFCSLGVGSSIVVSLVLMGVPD